jgi:hypothetical protein
MGNVPNYLSDAGGLPDCGDINSLDTQALELHRGVLLDCHRYYRVDASLAPTLHRKELAMKKTKTQAGD